MQTWGSKLLSLILEHALLLSHPYEPRSKCTFLPHGSLLRPSKSKIPRGNQTYRVRECLCILFKLINVGLPPLCSDSPEVSFGDSYSGMFQARFLSPKHQGQCSIQRYPLTHPASLPFPARLDNGQLRAGRYFHPLKNEPWIGGVKQLSPILTAPLLGIEKLLHS